MKKEQIIIVSNNAKGKPNMNAAYIVMLSNCFAECDLVKQHCCISI